MAPKRMLIDASHPEETRVAIVSGQYLEDFDVEVESRRQLRGNIYLAKVTRVEPSLQAAFVDYGGNRHGFLAFSEIHPDYYQIPVADREALVAEQKVAETEAENLSGAAEEEPPSDESPAVETLGGDDTEDVQARRPPVLKRRYKIQEVIKRRQILLVQVVREERGTKGAALTTYLSLAGRYCVLMPNTARGGGISRKISNSSDRKRLKTILNGLDIPGVMAVIVRTAGQKRSKAEIKRDYEYLMRVWELVREVTLESMAPCLVHEEGNLIKRSIRDLYDKDIDEIIISGDASYRTAKDFMKLLIPSHTKRVQPFKETDKQLFQHFQVEEQLDAMHSPDVQLKSGGYIVINPTEALVSIDVNSGRATRGRNIEETAVKTNLEASDEIARQLKLRDLAGLIVIDYIDMDENRNKIKVERRLKDVMRSDRARIQIGRISPFGLMELSRQRMRPSLIETSSDPCPYCEGTGIRRSTDSATVHLLRAIEDEGMQKRSTEITVFVPTTVALYVINNHRNTLSEIEAKYQLKVTLENDDTLIPPNFRIERGQDDAKGQDAPNRTEQKQVAREEGGKRRRRRGGGENAEKTPETLETVNEEAANAPAAAPTETPSEGDGEKPPERAKRRRGRRGGRRRGRKPAAEAPMDAVGEQSTAPVSTETPDNVEAAPEQAGNDNKKAPATKQKEAAADSESQDKKETAIPTRKPRPRRPKKTDAVEAKPEETPLPPAKEAEAEKPVTKTTKKPRHAAKPKVEIPIEVPVDQKPAAAASEIEKTVAVSVDKETDSKGSDEPARKGWWSLS